MGERDEEAKLARRDAQPPAEARYIKEEPAAERALEILMRLVTEVAVMRERLDTVERLLAENALLSARAIEEFTPDRSACEARADWRREYLERLMR